MDILQQKYERLHLILSNMKRVAVAFSSGVDSTFLLFAAIKILGNENVIAITAKSEIFPQREQAEAADFCKAYNIKHIFCNIDSLNTKDFCRNPPNRCYICKKHIFTKIKELACRYNINYIIEGTNVDDTGDYRPGMLAIKELGINSPLKDAGLTKQDIRDLSKQFNLQTWEKPSYACLASRFVYGEIITSEKLKIVELAEQYLIELGFVQERVRIHGNIARIEILPCDFAKLLDENTRLKIYSYFKSIGFDYIALDLKGYRTGSMNEVLKR